MTLSILLGPDTAAHSTRPTTLAWALSAEDGVAALRADVHAGRHGYACGLLLNRAVELIPPPAQPPLDAIECQWVRCVVCVE